MWPTSRRSSIVWEAAKGLAAPVLVLALSACRQDMHDQLKVEPLEESKLFADGRGARDPVEGTVARGHLDEDRVLYEGRRESADEFTDTFPFPVTRAVLERGQERYNIFCAPCHSRTGAGDGMIVRRGFRHPPALWDEKLRKAPVGHLFDVVTRGLGSMPAYARQIPVNDRWAILAYVRALQLAHYAELDALPADERERALSAVKEGGAP
jgi:mono/diheme cytochrome c family protein